MQRFMLLTLAAAGICLSAVPAAAQQDYPPTAQPPAVSDPSPAAGESITITGTGYQPNSTVTVTISTGDGSGTGTLAAGGVLTSVSVTTDATGSFSVNVTIPAGAQAGTYVVTASGVDPTGAPRVERTTLTVGAPASGGGGGGLPLTGSDTGRTMLSALALLAIGTGAVIAVRQRRVRNTTDVRV